jgi:hypothetical protein
VYDPVRRVGRLLAPDGYFHYRRADLADPERPPHPGDKVSFCPLVGPRTRHAGHVALVRPAGPVSIEPEP